MKSVKSYVCILSFIFLSLFFPYAPSANPLDNWVAVTSPSDHWFYGMTYGNGTFVTVGDYGTILTSPDGVAWTLQTSGFTNHLAGVGFGNNAFVAVGTVGIILTSWDNGETWTLTNGGQAHPLSQNLTGVAYGAGKFVVVGADGTILVSSDNGVTWVDPFWPYSSVTTNWLYGTIYANSTYGYVGVGAYGTVLTSPNTTDWYTEASGTSRHLMSVTYGNGSFVTVGESGTILSSIDGVNWSPQTSGVTDWLRGVTYANGYFVAVGDAGTILTSADGVNWDPPLHSFDDSYDLYAVAYDANESAFAAVGGYGIILLDGDSIPDPPVRIQGAPPAYFSTLQTAYNSASDGDELQSQALHFGGDLSLGRNISVSLKGGYDGLYIDNPSKTTIDGTLIVSNGAVTVENLVIR
jgi:photosystem II stability/assembly factor-like uncharacterized protein